MTAVNSSMTEDYLKALYSADEWGEGGLGVTELARRMGVVASTASENVRKLHREGLVDHAPYQKVHLTEAGRQLAVAIVRRHRILETYLYERLGFDWDEVHREAEILEHAVSDALLARMNEVLGHPLRDPHGDPIPQPENPTAPLPARSLTETEVGVTATVTRISDDEPALLRHLESLGLVLDSQVTVLERLDFAGVFKVEIQPPATWQPRNEKSLADAVGPGQKCVFDLGHVAAQAVWVVD